MEIDLFTLIAQIINLLILLFLLRKFLYLPVLKAVADRQKAIADELQASEDAQKKARQTVKDCEKQMQKLEAQKHNILQQAHKDADKLAAELNDLAREEYLHTQKQWQQRMEAEQEGFERTVRKAISVQFNHFAQKALQQIADIDISDLAVNKFIKQLQNLPEAEQKVYAEAFQDKKQIEIQSASALGDKNKTELEKCIRTMWNLSSKTKFVFTVNPELISGLCLVAEEQLIAWNLEEYIQQFGKNLNKEVTQFLNRGKND